MSPTRALEVCYPFRSCLLVFVLLHACLVRVAPSRAGAFRTMDGHASTVSLHPSSLLAGHSEELNWVLFREVVWTSKVPHPIPYHGVPVLSPSAPPPPLSHPPGSRQPFMRTVTPIEYAWVRDLLPKLHEVDVIMNESGTFPLPVPVQYELLVPSHSSGARVRRVLHRL
jgi:hypothetical protein